MEAVGGSVSAHREDIFLKSCNDYYHAHLLSNSQLPTGNAIKFEVSQAILDQFRAKYAPSRRPDILALSHAAIWPKATSAMSEQELITLIFYINQVGITKV